MSAQAFALAPVIGYIKSPIVADDTPNTNANLFVYPDAMDLNSMAVDDNTASSAIIWSYTGAGKYRINDRDPLTIGPDDPIAPGAKALSAGDDPDAVDSNLRTITFRNNDLSPVGGPNIDPNPGPNPPTTIIPAETQVITLFASDGTAASSKSVMVYTEAEGTDRLSGVAPLMTSVAPQAAPPDAASSLAWSSSTVLGTVTLTNSSGLCLNVPGPGDNWGLWVSPYGITDLVNNNVYRFRLRMDDNTTSNLAAGTTPLWLLVVDNFNAGASDGVGENKYIGEMNSFDNYPAGSLTGGVNPLAAGVSTATPRTFDYWWCPPPITAADWNGAGGEFDASHDADNDIRMHFDVLDLSIPGIDATTHLGAVCIRTLQIDRVPISSLTVKRTVYDVSNITASTHVVGTIFTDSTLTSFVGGNLTISPDIAGALGINAWDLEVITFDPGNTDISTPAEMLDNWPFQWTANSLFKGTVGVQAPNSQGESNPPDVIKLLWDSPTNELLASNGIVASVNTLGLPKLTGSDLTGFYFGMAGTNSTGTNNNRLRLRLQLLLTQSVNSGAIPTNTGGITITKMRVDEMDLPSN